MASALAFASDDVLNTLPTDAFLDTASTSVAPLSLPFSFSSRRNNMYPHPVAPQHSHAHQQSQQQSDAAYESLCEIFDPQPAALGAQHPPPAPPSLSLPSYPTAFTATAAPSHFSTPYATGTGANAAAAAFMRSAPTSTHYGIPLAGMHMAPPAGNPNSLTGRGITAHSTQHAPIASSARNPASATARGRSQRMSNVASTAGALSTTSARSTARTNGQNRASGGGNVNSRSTSSSTAANGVAARSRPMTKEEKLEERRRKNRESSSRCYYNRKRLIEGLDGELNLQKQRAVALYQRELELRHENARLKKDLVLRNIQIPPHMLVTTPTDRFLPPPVL